MNSEKYHIRHCLLHYYHAGKTATEARRIICQVEGGNVISDRISKFWFSRFKNGDFDLNDKPRSGRPQEADDAILEALLDQNANRSTRELSAKIGVSHTTVLKRLHSLGKVQKDSKWQKDEASNSKYTIDLKKSNKQRPNPTQ